MNRCKTCKYWKQYNDEDQRTTNLFGECNCERMGSDLKDSLIGAYDDSLPLTTREDFGCVLHEVKQ